MTLSHRTPVIGVIGGSGLSELDELKDGRWERIQSPFGPASDAVLLGRLAGLDVAFLPRHGRGHRIPPTHINACANIDILKRVGCTDILSFTAVGSLREELAPGTFVMIDQYIDRTVARVKTFFGPGFTAHVSMAEPVCGRLSGLVVECARELGIPNAAGGTYLVMEGPQFSTRAESAFHRSFDCSIIGMTAMPEAKLAREAEMCFCTIAMVTDYDCWHSGHEPVTAEDVSVVMRANVGNARRLLLAAVSKLSSGPRALCQRGCETALDGAVMTAPDAFDPAMLQKLDAVCARFLAGSSAPSSTPAEASRAPLAVASRQVIAAGEVGP